MLQLYLPLVKENCDLEGVQLLVDHSCPSRLLLVVTVYCLLCALQGAHRQLCAPGRGTY